MARGIFTISVRIAFIAALMAATYNFIRNLLAQTIVKNKILSLKFVFETLFLHLMHVFDNSAFEMENL